MRETRIVSLEELEFYQDGVLIENIGICARSEPYWDLQEGWLKGEMSIDELRAHVHELREG